MTSEDAFSAKSVTMESTTGKHGDSLAEKAEPFQASKTSILIRTRRSNPYYDYFNRTNGHLDINSMTICSGSRYLCGDLPRVRWDGNKFFIHWFFTDRASPILRSRQLFAF